MLSGLSLHALACVHSAFGAALLMGWALGSSEASAGRGLASERVETRPVGALTGKIVYLNAGHGWTAANQSGGAWTTQRGETFEIVEDLLRPIGDQIHEVVLDNDDPGVTFEGPWSNSSSPV